jgi:putative oxidoreductase
MHDLIRSLDRLRPVALLILRVSLGAIFLLHGLDKFDVGIEMIEGMFTQWGVPAPGVTAPLVAVLEIVGGLALILGAGTRVAAAVLSLVLLGAIFYVKADLGVISTEPMPGAEVDLALLGGLIAVLVIGPGSLSVDGALGLEPSEEDAAPVPVAA